MSTIEGFRTAINSVWNSAGRSLSDDMFIQNLFRSFRIERPLPLVKFPKWDLPMVLRMLTRPPYHPIETANPSDLTAKTVFLLLLATARRRGDIHAIDPKRVCFTDKGDVVLEPIPGYLPKVLANAEGQARYLPMCVRSLAKITNDPDELSLCPVKALKAYENYANRRAPNRPQFFISTKSGAKPVCVNTISGWVVKLIRKAYESVSPQDAALASTSVHDIRAQATSLVFQSTFSLHDVVKAATWATPTTFIQHYLREISGLQGKIHTIGPCIMAGSILH